jgi:KDO2-lipid IV(A) lauroyltransferase
MDHRALSQRLAELVVGNEHVDAALADGRGAVMALPHSGNWDMAGVWFVKQYGRFTTVAERLKPESLYRRFIDYRESLGFEVIPLSGGEQPPFPLLSQRLVDNKLVCLMAERDLSRTGVQVDFFGEPTRMPAGPAKLAINTGAALLPVHCWYDDDCCVEFYPPVDCSGGDVGVVTQALADVFARNIAKHPADWHMLQPQWLADLSDERRARLADT